MTEPAPSWAQVLTERPVEDFLRRVMMYQRPIESLVLVAPFIGPLKDVNPSMTRLVDRIDVGRIRTYIITNEPSADQTVPEGGSGHTLSEPLL